MYSKIGEGPSSVPDLSPQSHPQSLGIERGHYIAIQSRDPAAAAAFAAGHMGFDLVHVDGEGRHYLSAHGLDPYSLVYAPGDGVVDHISYLVKDSAALERAAETLTAAGRTFERIDVSPMWRHHPAIRFSILGGAVIELTTGVDIPVPMGELVPPPMVSGPAPLTFDHAVTRQTDVGAAIASAIEELGLRESGRIVATDGLPILAFFRARTLFHCYGVARSDREGMHHYQFTLKNYRAVMVAYERMAADPEVEMVWGPLRHGCGQNVGFYFFDQMGNIVEYTAEEELILVDETYEAVAWSVTDQRATDEWGTESPAPMNA